MHNSKIASHRNTVTSSIARIIPRIILSILILLATPLYAATITAAPKSITVVVDDNYPPYIFRDQDGNLDGYLVDIWKLWQEKTGTSVNLIATDWATALAAIAEGEADVIDTIFVTPERTAWLDFTPPYADIPVPIFAHKSIGGIADISTLRGFLVGVKAGDACAEKLAAANIDTLKTYNSYSALVQGAINAEVKVFCLDQPPATYLLYKAGADHDFRKSFTLYTGQFHRAVRKGDQATLLLLAKGFDAISPNERQKLQDKWMGSSLGINPWTRYLIYGFATALLLGVLLAGWGMLLRRQVALRTRDLENERARLRTVLSTLPDLVWLKDINGVYLTCNRVFELFFGAEEKQIVGKTDYDFLDKEIADTFRNSDVATLQLDGPHKDEKWLTFSGNDYRGLFETVKTPMRDAKGNIIGVLGIAHDITTLMQSREALDFLAHHDSLTKLPNRLLFRDRLDHAIARAQREHSELAILFIDLDRFKNVNDALGHMVGDDLLREVATRLAAQVRVSDTLARLGGDEFILLIEEQVQTEYITTIAEKLLGLFANPWIINDRSLFIGASIGISRFPADGTNADALIKYADMAMYRAKELGRNTFQFFEPAQSTAAMERMLLENMLRGAVGRNELLLQYQPQIDMITNRLIGVEALVRWQHPELGLIPPNRFIPIAEEIGIIVEIGDWVFRECCRQMAQWRATNIYIPRVSINLSVQQAERADLASWVDTILRQYALEPTDIEIEVTESLLMHQTGRGMGVLDNLDALGVRLSVDDFGTGYSSLSYLRRMPVSCLKIDRSFVCDIGRGLQNEVIVRAIIALAKSLSMDVIAEGVETEEQIQFLLAENCVVAQGFFYSRPLYPKDLEEKYWPGSK